MTEAPLVSGVDPTVLVGNSGSRLSELKGQGAGSCWEPGCDDYAWHAA